MTPLDRGIRRQFVRDGLESLVASELVVVESGAGHVVDTLDDWYLVVLPCEFVRPGDIDEAVIEPARPSRVRRVLLGIVVRIYLIPLVVTSYATGESEGGKREYLPSKEQCII
jgi:hypothetical protein